MSAPATERENRSSASFRPPLQSGANPIPSKSIGAAQCDGGRPNAWDRFGVALLCDRSPPTRTTSRRIEPIIGDDFHDQHARTAWLDSVAGSYDRNYAGG